MSQKITHQQWKFVQEYCVDFHGTNAAIRAGYSEKTANEQASRLLANVNVAAAVEERKSELAAVAELTPAWVLKQWKMIAEADPNELIQLKNVNCRHCYGVGHQYQWTENEYFAEVERLGKAGKDPPDCMGGFGFECLQVPYAKCPECGGDGVDRLRIADTRHLKGSARRLYAGVKQTKNGIEIVMRDQDGALANISKYLGMLIDRKELTGPGGGPMGITHLSPEDLTDEQLAAVVGAASDDAG